MTAADLPEEQAQQPATTQPLLAIHDENPQDRRSAVWRACDRLAQSGKKPSVRLVRQFEDRLKGSDGYIQEDIKLWFDRIFNEYTMRRTVPGLPPEVAELFIGVFARCTKVAAEQFSAERERFARDLASAHAQVEMLAAKAHSIETTLIETERKVADGEFAIQVAKEQITDLSAKVQDGHVQRQSLQMAHQDELVRVASAHSDALAKLEVSHRETVQHERALRAADATRYAAEIDRIGNALNRADEQYRALQIEHAKAVEDARKAKAETTKLNALTADLQREIRTLQEQAEHAGRQLQIAEEDRARLAAELKRAAQSQVGPAQRPRRSPLVHSAPRVARPKKLKRP